MIRKALQKIIDGRDLSRKEAFQTMDTIMNGEASAAQIGAFLVAMRMKGEKSHEIAGFAESMRKKANPVVYGNAAPPVDLVGTGGDGKNTFNISTVASLVVAGAGVPVAKHGNRSVSSKCGSADVLKALGVNIELTAEQMSECLATVGIAFLFAPKLHPAMRHAVGPRREIGIRSVFNILGPITNPAGVKHQLIGVYDRRLAKLLAEVLHHLASEHVMLVHSKDGMDEISLACGTYVAELKDQQIREYEIEPEEFGLPVSGDGINGGDAAANAMIAEAVLKGKKGPARDITLANAAAGFYVAGAAKTLREGVEMARESINSGAAYARLQQLRVFTNNLVAAV